MTAAELQTWLAEHADSIMYFVDLEIGPRADDDLMEVLGKYWFRGETGWNPHGYRFERLGSDGTGSEFAIWYRPGASEPHPIVFFGSEGGRGVLSTTPARFAQVLAHGPSADEYPGGDGPACWVDGDNWMLDEEADDDDEPSPQELLATYKAAVEARFGPLPDFEALTGDVDVLNAEFCGWVASIKVSS